MFKILRRHPPGGATVGSSLAFDPTDYERIVAAAAIEELTPTEFISDVALLALDLPGDIATPPSIGAMPSWLIALGCTFAVAKVIRVAQLTTNDGIRLSRNVPAMRADTFSQRRLRKSSPSPSLGPRSRSPLAHTTRRLVRANLDAWIRTPPPRGAHNICYVN